jgi:polyisoprenoid-binding protein YceI
MRTRTARAFSVLALLAFVGLPAHAGTEVYDIDAVHSQVAFKIRHLVSKVVGRFNAYEGAIEVDRENIANTKINVTIDVASIDTANDRRDGHLKSPDFFDVENNPKMTFTSTKVVPKGESQAEVHGDLTMRGVTKPVVLQAQILGFGDGMGGFEATGTINRKDFGIVWNRALDSGGVVLGDEVEISLNVEARRAKPEETPKG